MLKEVVNEEIIKESDDPEKRKSNFNSKKPHSVFFKETTHEKNPC